MIEYLLVIALTYSGTYNEDFTKYKVVSPYDTKESCLEALRGPVVADIVRDHLDSPMILQAEVACLSK